MLNRVAMLGDVPVISTTEISRRLGMTISSTFLRSLGLEPFADLSPGIYWRADEFHLICGRIADHVSTRVSL